MGWGDSLISLFDILNCSDYIKKKYPDIEITLVVNDCASKNINHIFPQVFDVDFFNTFFNNVIVQEKQFFQFSTDNKLVFNDENFVRIFSGRNGDLIPNIPGIFDVYVKVNTNFPIIYLCTCLTLFFFSRRPGARGYSGHD